MTALLLLAMAAGQPAERIAGPPPADTGPWIAIPRSELDALERQAKEPGVAAMVSAHYSATLEGTDLAGMGRWKIAARQARSFSLDPLNLAIRDAKWPLAPAVLERSAVTRLKVDDDGELTFAWSARGREEAGSLRWDLEWPAAPIATLELHLPEGWSAAAPEALVDGPRPSLLRGCDCWRLACGGKSRVSLRLVPPGRNDGIASADRTAVITPGTWQTTASFDFDIEALREPTTAWRFAAGPEVRILDATLPPKALWQREAGFIIVRFPEPVAVGKAGFQATWSGDSSGIRFDGLPGRDRLEYRIPAEIRLESWESRDYELAEAKPLPNRGYALRFDGSWRSGPGLRQEPVLNFKPAGPDVAAAAAYTFKSGPRENRLEARLQLRVLSGPAPHFGVLLPEGYRVKSWKLAPDDPGATIAAAGRVWRIEPSRPWAAGQSLDLKLDLRGAPGSRPTPLQNESGREIAGELSVESEQEPKLQPVIDSPLPNNNWAFDRLSVRADWADGSPQAILRGVILSTGTGPPPIDWPQGSRLQSAIINGRPQSQEAWANLAGLVGPAEFEVNYTLPTNASSLPEIAPLVNGVPVRDCEWRDRGAAWYAFGQRIPWVILPLSLVFMIVLAGMMRIRRAMTVSLIALAGVTAAQPPASRVYLDGDRAFVSASYHASLEHAARGWPAATVASARIIAREQGDSVRLEIAFAIDVASDSQAIEIPVRDLLMESAALNGQPAFPQSLPGGRIRVGLPARGRHSLTLTGRVPVAVRGAELEAIIGLDPLPSVEVEWIAADGSRDFDIPNRQGRLGLTPRGFEADLGSSSPATIRWRRGKPSELAIIGGATVTAWDPAGAAVQSLLKVESGRAAKLEFEIPPGTEPGRFTLRRSDGKPAGFREIARSTLAGRERVTLVPQEPLEGTVTVSFRLFSVAPLPANPSLAPVRFLSVNAPAREWLAVKSSSPVQKIGLLPGTTEALARDTGFPLDAAEWQIARCNAADAHAKLATPKASLARPIAEEIDWRFAGKAEVSGLLTFASESLAVEFDLPPGVVLADLIADDLAGFQRIGSRIKLWFRSRLDKPVVIWRGSWPAMPKSAVLELPMPAKSTAARVIRLGGASVVLPARDWTTLPCFRSGKQAWRPGPNSSPLKVKPAANSER